MESKVYYSVDLNIRHVQRVYYSYKRYIIKKCAKRVGRKSLLMNDCRAESSHFSFTFKEDLFSEMREEHYDRKISIDDM